MRRRLSLVLMMSLALHAGAATAQDATKGSPQDSPQSAQAPQTLKARRLKLDTVCKASLERFCPELEAMPGQTRNQIICLKPYRSSLPLPCRSAVTAGMR